MKMESRGKAGKAGVKEDFETTRGEGRGRKIRGRWKEGGGGGGARYSMKLEAVCYIHHHRIFSLLANVTN